MSLEKLTKHHITPKSKGGSDRKENIALIEDREHRAYHNLFGNRTKKEILYYLERKFWSSGYNVV